MKQYAFILVLSAFMPAHSKLQFVITRPDLHQPLRLRFVGLLFINNLLHHVV